ncbi:MAG TPA: hypothetical protein VJN42_09315 [Candidatus Acidoferrum sp.]|nr:hypothetical protein [Candidatus Acidoferrum sp.]
MRVIVMMAVKILVERMGHAALGIAGVIVGVLMPVVMALLMLVHRFHFTQVARVCAARIRVIEKFDTAWPRIR